MRLKLSPQLVSVGMAGMALTLGVALLHGAIPAAISPGNVEEAIQGLVLRHATLPRLAMALLCGAGLAVSGAILQQVLRNPLASPDTVGVNAGARLALALATLMAPGLLGYGRDLVAIGGALVSVSIVLLIARARQFSPLTLILTGLIVSLYCGALATILVLLKDRYLVGLFLWGSGSLSQQSWQPAIDLSIRLGACVLPLLVLLRPLSVLDAGEDAARSLGVPIERIRLASIALSVLMAAFVTSSVGVIGFISLVAPALATLSGARGFAARCVWSGVFGALLLLVTDVSVQLFAGNHAAFLPTGAVTAVIGSPLLLVLLSRLRTATAPSLVATTAFSRITRVRKTIVPKPQLAAAIAVVALALLTFVGRAPDGAWAILDADMYAEVLPWRLPRTLGAAGAGGLLAVGGFILQRITGNPMASPEIMGVSAGAILGAATVLFFAGSASPLGLTASATAGAFAALLLILAFSIRSSHAPERILLAGVALTALVDALVGVLMATGDPNSVMLLAWMSGSTNGFELHTALGVMAAALLLSAISLLGARWLSILPLGASTARSIGVPVTLAHALLLLLVAVVTAIATPVIGPLTFVGLMAPHFVILLGIRHVPTGLLLSSAIGAALMALADTLARTLAFPMQLPTGILASLLAVPFLLLLVLSAGRSRRAHAS